MTELEELEQLRKEQGPLSELEELEILRKEQGPLDGLSQMPAPKPKEPEGSFASQAAGQAYSTLAKPIVAASQAIDPYVGAPFRAALNETINEREESMREGLVSPVFSPRPVKAAISQFGEDPSKAPSWSQLAERWGADPTKNISVPTVKNFGSPNARFAENKVSMADIAGGVAGAGVDPINAIPGARLVERLGKMGRTISKGVLQGAVEPGVSRFATLTAGVPGEVLKYYRENHPRLKNMEYTREGSINLGEKIMGAADDVNNRVKVAELEVKEAENALKQARDQAMKSISPKQVVNYDNLEGIQHLIDVADREKQLKLNALADAELEKLPIFGPVEDLKDIILREAEAIPMSSDENIALRKRVENIAKYVDNEYQGYMSGPQIREWMKKTLDPIIDFDRPVGQIDALYNRTLKKIRRQVQEGLKKIGEKEGTRSPYRKLIDEMHEKRNATEAVMELFGNRKTGGRSLSQLYSNANPAERQYIVKTLQNWAKTNEYPQVLEILDEFDEYNKLYDETLRGGLGKSLGEPYENFNEATLNKIQAEDNANSIRNIKEGSIDKFMTDLGRAHGGKHQSEKQLQNLGDLAGEDFLTPVRDMGNLREWSLDRTRGSKRTTPGTVIGSVGGLALGSSIDDPINRTALAAGLGYAGRKFGEVMDVKGGEIARKWVDRSMNAQAATEAFFNKMQNPSGAFKKYADVINKTSQLSEYPVKGMLLYHHLLWNNDPEYRKALTSEEP